MSSILLPALIFSTFINCVKILVDNAIPSKFHMTKVVFSLSMVFIVYYFLFLSFHIRLVAILKKGFSFIFKNLDIVASVLSLRNNYSIAEM